MWDECFGLDLLPVGIRFVDAFYSETDTAVFS
jgi:hypothetical protein